MIILRLQGLPWTATAKDIRQHFDGLSIPDGGVHIIGGEEGDVFIAFGSDEDARKAMQRQKQPLNGGRIMLLLSSKSEMQEVIAESRAAAQSVKPDPFGTVGIVTPSVPETSQRSLLPREGSVTSSHSQGYQGFPQNDDQRRQPTGYGDSFQVGNVNAPSQSLPTQDYNTSYPPSQSNERLDYGQSQNQMYGNDRFKEESFGRGDASQRSMYQEFNPQERNLGIQRREDLDAARQGSTGRDRPTGYPQDSAQFNRLSEYDRGEGRMPSADVEDRQFRSGSYGSSSGPLTSDRDMSYMQGSDKPRSLLPSPGMMKSDERSYQEQLDDPMEGISTSYPPAGPADGFDNRQYSDEDQRGSGKQVEPRDIYSGLTQPMSGYGRQSMDKEPDKGRYIKTPYEDAYWATSTSSKDRLSEPMQGRRPDDVKSFQDNQGKPMTERREEYYQSQGSNENEMKGDFSGNEQYASALLDQGTFYDQKDKPMESFSMDRSQSAGYPMFPDYRSGEKSSDFDSRLGDMSKRAPLLNQEPPFSSLKAAGDHPSFDSQTYGSRRDHEPPISSAPALLDHPAPESPIGAKLPLLEPSGDEFYAVRLTGLPFDCSDRGVRLFLRDINIAPDGVQIHRDHRGRITGTANIKLQGPSDIDQALKRHQQYMGKRYIDVRPCLQSEWEKEKQVSSAEPSKRRSRSPVRGRNSPLRNCNTCIEMRGLASFTKNSDIVDFFEGLAMRQDSIYLDPNKDGTGSGIAYLEFIDPDMARRACQKNGRQFNRRTVSIRIISKEIMDAKITDTKRRAERRSPTRRSPDRRRGSSPYSRRGRSPGKRGRSPVRSSSRSSPGRNGPGRKPASPSRDRRDRDRDRESSRQSRRAQSPVRHSSQDRKDSTSEKKDRKDHESREVRSLSKVEEVKSRGSPKTEDKDRLHKSVTSKDAPPKALLPSPDLGMIQKEKGKDQGLLKTPEHPANEIPPAFSRKQKEVVPVNIQQRFPPTDGRADVTKQAPVIDFHAIRDAVSRFSKDTVDLQKGEGRQDPMESGHGVPENRQIQMGMSGGMLGDNRAGPRDNFPFANERQEGERPMDLQRGPLGSSRRGFGDNGRDGPMDMHSGLAGNTFGGPRDDIQGGLVDTHRGPLGNAPGGPMDMHHGPFGGPRDNRGDDPMNMHRGPMGNTRGPGDKRIDNPMDMHHGPFGGPGDNRRNDPSDMHRGPFGGPGDNRRGGPMDYRQEGGMSDGQGRMQDSWQGGPRPGRQNDDMGGAHMQNSQGRSLEEWRKNPNKEMDGSMDFREERPNEERRHPLLEDHGPHSNRSGERRTLLDRPEGPPEGNDNERDVDRRQHGILDRQDTDRRDERRPGGINRRDSSPGRWTGNKSEERFSSGGFGFPEQGSDDHSLGRNGPGSRAIDRDSFPGDKRNLSSQQSDPPFPQGRNIPGLLDEDKGENKRGGSDNQGSRDPHGRMDRHRGSQDRSDHRAMDRGMHEPGQREPHHNTGPLPGPHGRPEDAGTSEYVCAHIRNVPYSARWPDIAHFFSGLQIVPGGIHIMVNSDGKPTGHCFIEFADAHNARLTEERRLHPMRDRPLQINACSKAMMIRALEESGEMMQNRPQHNFAGRGGGPSFGPRGPRFPGDMRGPFPGPGPRHSFGPRGPHPGGPFRPPFGEPDRMGDGHPRHPHNPRHNERPREEREYQKPQPSNTERPREEREYKKPQPLNTERPREEREYKKPQPSKESAKSEPVSKGPGSAPKANPPGESPNKPQPEKPKETVPEAKEKKITPVSTAALSVHLDKHKGCVVTATNLPLTITVDAIGDFFKGCSTIKGAIKLDTNEATGKATGQAKIVFTSPAEANRAIKERNNRPLNGRIVRLHVM